MVQMHVNECDLLDAFEEEVLNAGSAPVYMRFGDTDLISKVRASEFKGFRMMLQDMGFLGCINENNVFPHLREDEGYRRDLPVWGWEIVEFGSNGVDEVYTYQIQIDYPAVGFNH